MIKIAIDGPSGSGKSTLAKNLAKELGFIYVDTGALYRSIALHMLKNGISCSDDFAVCRELNSVDVKLIHDDQNQQRVILNGEDVSGLIRTSEVSSMASVVSAIKQVRIFLLDIQRNIAKHQNVVMDGRDIGTVIFPDADVKIFLVAGNESRAKRRHRELVSRGEKITFEQVLSDLDSRDSNDCSRKESPAVPAADAVQLDNSEFEPSDTLEHALKIVYSKLPRLKNKEYFI